MSKVSQILPAFVFAVLISAVTSDDCLSQTQTWGVVDNPYVFQYCDPTTNTSATAECAEGRGYVNNGTSVGCIPWQDWSDDCISKVDPSTITCEGNNQKQPIPSGNPGTYLLCLRAGEPPVSVSCQPGRGYCNKDGFLGCVPFEMWRNITGCVNTA